MRNWKDISLFKFQQIEAINTNPNYDDIDKIGFSTCVIFGMTEYQLDNAKPRKALRLTNKVAKIFSTPFNPEPESKIGKYKINYDCSTLTLGQYMELSFYLTNPIQNAHKALASVAKSWINKDSHEKKSEYLLKQSVSKITGSISLLLSRMSSFNKRYGWLFGVARENNDNEVPEDPFLKKFGWMYAATQVAEMEKITLNETYGLNVIHAFNDLAYLKEKGKFEQRELKKK